MAKSKGSWDPAHFRATYPKFLELLDTDPEQSWVGFSEYVWKFLEHRKPDSFRGLDQETQEDIVADLIAKARIDDYKLLRSYEDRGVAFSAWVRRVLRNRAFDILRRSSPKALDQENTETAHADAIRNLAIEEIICKVQACMDKLPSNRRLLLQYSADGFQPRQLKFIAGEGYEDNKKLGDLMRTIRRSVLRCLKRKDIREEDLRDALRE
ncbi:MAG: hypothetical protein HKN21_11650 [Candidatus Eisenbacteria bacterium]|uniref:RNA polymerase sigma-70 region 2 domain-containing protein n=1 Tax=Eiseniibacteriota bacterium TaxID=2212470 RepID=A0A7Y2EAE2_UNCEI|nr:hypothetical protein [Candidatus Eisenbacteria bacterium]